MLVIVLTKVPQSLRGDLTKWCQEIQTGVYVGNVSARIRDALWQRVLDNIGHGEATMAYNTNNELGYQFRTTRTDKEVIDFDGIPLMMSLKDAPIKRKLGFSKAYHHHKAITYGRKQAIKKDLQKSFVVVDVETTGLDFENDQIISIGAVNSTNKEQNFYRLVHASKPITQKVANLTGIDNDLLAKEGLPLTDVLNELRDFIGSHMVISYNANFDRHFLQKACAEAGVKELRNVFVDLMRVVKEHDLFLDNYRLETVLTKYGIVNEHPHNSLSDALSEYELSMKLIKNGTLKF